MPRWNAYTEALQDAGIMRAGDALHPADSATTVRVRDGETQVTDGPFAETKETLVGYYVIEVPDLDAALKYAARMPNITYGSVEVRPVVDFSAIPAPDGAGIDHGVNLAGERRPDRGPWPPLARLPA